MKSEAKVLEDFRKQYPSSTSSELQAFVLGYKACLANLPKIGMRNKGKERN